MLNLEKIKYKCRIGEVSAAEVGARNHAHNTYTHRQFAAFLWLAIGHYLENFKVWKRNPLLNSLGKQCALHQLTGRQWREIFLRVHT